MVDIITNPEFPETQDYVDEGAPQGSSPGPTTPDIPVISSPEYPLLNPSFNDYGFEDLDAGLSPPPPARAEDAVPFLAALDQNRYTFTEGALDKAFQEYGKAAPRVLASQVSTTLAGMDEFRGFFTYDSLKDGSAPIFNQLPQYRDVPVAERGLSDRQILNLLANTQDTSIAEQVGLNFPSAAMAMIGLEKGARVGAAVAKRLPLKTLSKIRKVGPPLAAGSRLGVVAVPAIIGAAGLGMLGDEIRKSMLEGDTVYNPADRTKVVVGRTLADAFTGAAIPYRMGSRIFQDGVDLRKKGVELSYLRHIKTLSELPTRTSIPVEEYLSSKFLKGVENLSGAVGNAALRNPKKMAVTEAVAGAGSVAGVGIAAEQFPGSPTAELTGSILGPMAPGMVARVLPGRLALDAVRSTFRGVPEEARIAAVKAGRTKPGATDWFTGFRAAQKLGRKKNAGRIMLEAFRTSGMKDEDITTFVESIADSKNGVFTASENGLFEMRKNPSMRRLMNNLEQLGYSFEEEGKAALNSQAKGLLGIAEAAFNADTNQGYLLASNILRGVETAKLQKDVLTRVSKLQEAFVRLSKDGDPEQDLPRIADRIGKIFTQQVEAGRATSKRLYDKIRDHDIVYDVDTAPSTLGQVETIGLPRGTGLSELGGPVTRATRLLRRIDEEYDDFVSIVSGQKSAGEVLSDVQKKMSDRGATLASSNREAYVNIETLLDAEDSTKGAVGRAEEFLKQYASKEPSPENTEMAEMLTLKLRELKLISGVNDPTSLADVFTVPYSELRIVRSSLLAHARNETTSTESGHYARRLAEVLEEQMVDMAPVREGFGGQNVSQLVADANAYYSAQKDIFNRGVLFDMSATDRQGVNAPAEILLKKMGTLGDPVALRIQELKLAERFTNNPSTGGRLPGTEEPAGVGADVAARIDEGRGANESVPPSIDAEVENFFSQVVFETKTGNQKVSVPEIEFETDFDIIKPNKIDEIIRRNSSEDPVKALNEGTPRVLDLLPGLRGQLEDIRKAGADIDTKTISHVRAAAKDLVERVYYKFTKSGQDTNFLETLIDGFKGKPGKEYLVKWDQLLEPIVGNPKTGVKGVQQLAEGDPASLVRQMADSPDGVKWLENAGVDLSQGIDTAVSNMSPTLAKKLGQSLVDDAKTGLRALIFDYAKDKARFSQGGDYGQLFEVLFKAPRERGASVRMPSLMNWMVKNEIIDKKDAAVYADTFRSMAKLQQDVAGMGGIPDKASVGTRAGARMFGAFMGSAFQRTVSKIFPFVGSSGTIQVPGYFADMSQNVLLDARVSAVQDGLFEILKDPAEAARMITALRDAAAGKPIGSGFLESIKNSFVKMGVIGPTKRGVVYGTSAVVRGLQAEEGDSALPETKDSELFRKGGFDGESNTAPTPAPGDGASLYGPRFSRQPTRQVAQAPKPAPFLEQIAQAAQPAQAPANAPRPAGQPNPEMRQRMAAAFPEDRDLMSGGIASMMS